MASAHKYGAGDLVRLEHSRYFARAPLGNYTIIERLPALGDDNQYRIKNDDEAFHRVAPERLLSARGG
jgi:hypothetical protein